MPLVFFSYLFVLIYDVVNTVALLFGLAFYEIVTALKFATEVKFFESPMYIFLAAVLIATSGLNLWLFVRMRTALKDAKLVPVLVGLLLLTVLDFSINTSPYHLFGSAWGSSQEFESAVTASGFDAKTLNPEGSNIIIVMVEGMGAFVNPEHQKLLQGPLEQALLLKRYLLSTGTVHYYGSTTAAEMRELCQTRDKYTTFLSARTNEFLPSLLSEAGYETTAIHGYTDRMFERFKWYPNVGFQKMIFADELVKDLPRVCGGVFKGVCDADIGDLLVRAARTSEPPQFLYWLSLNTHIPILPGEGRDRFNCSENGGPFGPPEVCNMTEMWLDVLDKVTELATIADLPPTEILIIGDHAPPLWSNRGRRLFEPGKVTWFRLSSNPDDSPQGSLFGSRSL